MVRLFVGAYSRQMGMGSVRASNYKQSSSQCPWSQKWAQTVFTLYVGDTADNFDVKTTSESITSHGKFQNTAIA
eukprot:5353638-Pyramimonas_sp.AAC.1